MGKGEDDMKMEIKSNPTDSKSRKLAETGNSHGHPASFQIWKYIFAFAEMSVVKCAIELKIADAIESHESPMTLSQLSSSLNCSPPLLHRIMRFLVNRGIFKEETTPASAYAQTPLSRLLVSSGENSMAPLLMLESSPVMVEPWHYLSSCVKGSDVTPFEAAHGEDVWSYAAENPAHSSLINEGLGCFARLITVPAVLEGCGEIFDGVESLVDVGGGNGTTLSILVKACPWIKGIVFDLPHVVSASSSSSSCSSHEYKDLQLQYVGGDMFEYVPKAHVALITSVLHDWDDEECIKILENCKEAIAGKKKGGKVIMVEVVINDEKKDEDNEKLQVALAMDMVMMAHTNRGKERTPHEWASLIHKAGFTKFTITPIRAVHSVIQAFP